MESRRLAPTIGRLALLGLWFGIVQALPAYAQRGEFDALYEDEVNDSEEAALSEDPYPEQQRSLQSDLAPLSRELEDSLHQAGPYDGPDGGTAADEDHELTAYGSRGPVGTQIHPPSVVNMPPPPQSLPLSGVFGPGFQFKTADDGFSLQFHNLTQLDSRWYGTPNQEPVRDEFVFPRQWLIFNGKLNKNYEYFTAWAFGATSVNLLDAFLNVHYDDRVQLKLGRFKTPFTYEFYTLPIQGLVTPERSLFFNNFGINRDVGAMVHGTVFNKQVDYAVGAFNGNRNGYTDTNDSKDVLAYVNYRPFEGSCYEALEHLNIGGSLAYGDANNPALPSVLRTDVATTGDASLGIPFLAFNPGVREVGPHKLFSAHLAYYYQQLSLIAEWESGTQEYQAPGAPINTSLPIQSYYVQAGYFLTGEVVTGRNVAKPICDFNPLTGGLGAIELMARYNYLDISNKVFSKGLADPTVWTNRLDLTDVGVNWYWNQYVKTAILWEHNNFASPVQFRPGATHSSSDMFWTRMQIYF
jgi:phosphate-selective porin OprO/OprP